MNITRTRTNLLLIGVLAVTFALHLLVIAEPFGRDQGIFAYIGQAILRGEVPYRDAWDHKTPGLYAVYALAFALFGSTMPALHLLEGIVITLAACIVYLIGRRLRDQALGLLGALLYGASATLLFEWWDRAQAEVYMGVTGALAVYLLLRAFHVRAGSADAVAGTGAPHYSAAAFVLSGLFAGLTVIFKPTGAGLAAGLALLVVLMLWRAGWRRALGALLALGSGAVLCLIPVLLYFAANGALGDLYQTIVVFNSYHARIGGNPSLAGSIGGTLDFVASMNILAPLAFVGVCASLSARKRLTAVSAAAILCVWLIGSAAGIWTQGKFFSYHWSAVLPALALLAAWGALAIVSEMRNTNNRAVRLLAVAVCAVVLAVYGDALARDHAPKWSRDAAYLTGRLSRADYLARFGHNILGRDIYSFSETQQTADYLRAHTNADDTVLVWGFDALVNYLADRRTPTRYIFNYPLTFDRPETAFRVQARRTFLRDISERPPLYIVLVTNDVNPLHAVDSLGLLAGFPEFAQVIAHAYHLETDIGEYHLYRRTAAP